MILKGMVSGLRCAKDMMDCLDDASPLRRWTRQTGQSWPDTFWSNDGLISATKGGGGLPSRHSLVLHFWFHRRFVASHLGCHQMGTVPNAKLRGSTVECVQYFPSHDVLPQRVCHKVRHTETFVKKADRPSQARTGQSCWKPALEAG